VHDALECVWLDVYGGMEEAITVSIVFRRELRRGEINPEVVFGSGVILKIERMVSSCLISLYPRTKHITNE
jgi:hypothetical protein